MQQSALGSSTNENHHDGVRKDSQRLFRAKQSHEADDIDDNGHLLPRLGRFLTHCTSGQSEFHSNHVFMAWQLLPQDESLFLGVMQQVTWRTYLEAANGNAPPFLRAAAEEL